MIPPVNALGQTPNSSSSKEGGGRTKEGKGKKAEVRCGAPAVADVGQASARSSESQEPSRRRGPEP